VPCILQMACHGCSHDTKPDETYVRHVVSSSS
jgi:hypothetical protein